MAKYNDDIIFLFSENARTKLKDFSFLLQKTPQRLEYALKVLEKDNIVYNPHCIFDYAYFGLLLFRVYFKSGYISEKDKLEIIKKLNENPYVVSLYELSGEFDLTIEIEAPNPSKFNKELRKIISYNPTLNKFKIILNLLTNIYPRLYLTNINKVDNIQREIIIGGDKEKLNFNNNEMIVMKNLLKNPKARLTSLAKISSLNVKTVNSIIKNLKNRKIIMGFKHIVDTNKLGINKFRLFLKIHNLNRERSMQLMNYMFKTQEIIQINKTVGEWDMEVDIESQKKEIIRQLINNLRENFKDVIEDFNIMEFYKYYKRLYLPEYLFS